MSNKRKIKSKKSARKGSRSESGGRSSAHRVGAQASSPDDRPGPQMPALNLDIGPDKDRPEDGQQIAELAERAMKYADSDELREELKNLSAREAAMFTLLIEKQLKRRKLQLIGYLLAFLALIIGMVVALVLYFNRDPGEFIGWAFLIPFAMVGVTLLIFGRLAKKA